MPKGQRWLGVFADNGELLGDVTPVAAVAIVRTAMSAGSPRYLRSVAGIDQWTLTNSLNLHRPLHRIALNDAAGTEVYVSALTGEIVMRSTASERAWAWIGPIAHWGAPEILRTHVGAWRQTMLWISGAGIALAITGLSAGVLRYRWRGYVLRSGRAMSPYVGWKHWHHWGGLLFGTITLTWMVSGWLYLNPGGSRSDPLETITTMSPYNVGGLRADQSSRPEQAQALSGGPLDPRLFVVPLSRAWTLIPRAERSRQPREVDLVRVGGTPYFVAYEAWDRSWILRADRESPALERFDPIRLTLLGAGMLPQHRLVEAALLDRYDGYYYAVGAVAPKRLPILRMKFDDPGRTWFYVDPHTGSIFRRYDAYGRAMRWALNGLHTLDFPLLFAHRPAWDLAIIGLSAGGMTLSLTGLVIGWRRLRWPNWRRGSTSRAPSPKVGRQTWSTRLWVLTLLVALSAGGRTRVHGQQFTPQTTSSAPAPASDQKPENQPPKVFEEVVVTASAKPEPIAQTAVTVQILDAAAIEASSATSVTGLLAENGIAYLGQWSPSQTSINLRGAATDGQGRDFRSQVVVLVNGRRAGTANLSKLSLRDLERIEIVRGPGSLVYGSQAIGGVINLITRTGVRGASQSIAFNMGSWGAVEGSGQTSGLVGKVDYSISAHAGRRGDYGSGDGSSERMVNTAYSQRGGLVALGYSRSSTERFSFTARTDGIYNAGFRGSQWDTDNFDNRSNHSIDVAYNRVSPGGRASFRGQYYYFRDVDDFHWGTEVVRLANGNAGPGYDHDDNFRVNSGNGAKAIANFAWAKGATLQTGADTEIGRLRNRRDRHALLGASPTQTAPMDNNADTWVTGLYAEQVQTLLQERLTFRGGLRFDYGRETIKATPNQPLLVESTADYTAVTYRAGLVSRARPWLALRGGVGTGYRAPTPTELTANFITVQGGQILGDPNLNPERTVSVDVGALMESGPFSLDLDLFRSRVRDRITTVALSSFQSRYVNRASSDVSGLEAQARTELGSFGLAPMLFWTSVNGVYNFVMRDNDAAARRLNSDRIDRMNRFQGSVQIGARHRRGWTAQVGGALSGPLWYATEENLRIPEVVPFRGYILRKDPFWLWDATGTYPLGRLMRLRASITNLLDANVHPTFFALNKLPYLSDPRFSNGGRGNSLPGRSVQIGIELRR